MNTKINSLDDLKALLAKNAQKKGLFFNKDSEFVNELLKGLLENLKRYGYSSCPCRLASGNYNCDADIICPCVYMKEDIEKYGACFCALYVSKDVFENNKIPASIPESRPKEKTFNMNNKAAEVAMKESDKMIFKCSICGYEHHGDMPEKCPKCGAGKTFLKSV